MLRISVRGYRVGRPGITLAAVLGVFAAGATVASATAPLGNRVYQGSDQHQVTFLVSANGRSVSDFSGKFPLPDCAMNVTPLPSSGTISDGRLTLREQLGLLTLTITGSFAGHGRVNGQYSYVVKASQGRGRCTQHFTWTAKALGPGTDVCANHVGPPHVFEMGPVGAEAYETDITATRVSCAKVNKALDAGKFEPGADASTGVGAFSTAGWTCTEPSADRYTCSRHKTKSDFAFRQSGTPCGYPGHAAGTQCATKAAVDRRRRS